MRTKVEQRSVVLVAGWPSGVISSADTGLRGSIVLPDGTIETVPRNVVAAISTSLGRWMNSLDISSKSTAKKPSKNFSRSKEKRSSTRGRTLKK